VSSRISVGVRALLECQSDSWFLSGCTLDDHLGSRLHSVVGGRRAATRGRVRGRGAGAEGIPLSSAREVEALASSASGAAEDGLPRRSDSGDRHGGARDRVYAGRSSWPAGRALVVAVEICSASYFRDDSAGTAVANAIFADGAAAVVLGTEGSGVGMVTHRTLFRPKHLDRMGFVFPGGRPRIVLSKEIRRIALEPDGRAGWPPAEGSRSGQEGRALLGPPFSRARRARAGSDRPGAE